jgi:hypothetical protein
MAPGKFFHAAPDRLLAAYSALAAALAARSDFNLSKAFLIRVLASSSFLIDFHSLVAASPSGVPNQVRRYRDGSLREP